MPRILVCELCAEYGNPAVIIGDCVVRPGQVTCALCGASGEFDVAFKYQLKDGEAGDTVRYVDEFAVCEPCVFALDSHDLSPVDGIIPLNRVAADHVLILERTVIGECDDYECRACGRQVHGNVFYDVIEYKIVKVEG